MAALDEVLSGIYSSNIPRGEQRSLAKFAVGMRLHAPAPEPLLRGQHCRESYEDALVAVGTLAGGSQKLTITMAKNEAKEELEDATMVPKDLCGDHHGHEERRGGGGCDHGAEAWGCDLSMGPIW